MSGDLDIELLRTFEIVADVRSFSATATDLGRSQSAISLQIQRLEQLTGRTLVSRSTRPVSLTRAGEILLVYSQRILNANDDALTHLREMDDIDIVRIGVPSDYATALLPPILARFAQDHPHIRTVVTENVVPNLLDILESGGLDVVLGTQSKVDLTDTVLARQRLHWVAAPGFQNDLSVPLPLVLFSDGCICRAAALDALGRINRPWRICQSVQTLAQIERATLALTGVTVLEQAVVPNCLRVLQDPRGLPRLEDVWTTLHMDEKTPTPAVRTTVDYMSAAFHEAR